jgi:hypothetical protein
LEQLKLASKEGAGRHFSVSRGSKWLGDLDWKSRWPKWMGADATITVASGYYDLRTRRGRAVLSFGGEEVARGRAGGALSGLFGSYRLDTAVSGWVVVGDLDQHQLDAVRKGDSFEIEVAKDANAAQLPLLSLFAHYLWLVDSDDVNRWGVGVLFR